MNLKTNQWTFDRDNARNVRLIKDCNYDFTVRLDAAKVSKDASDFLRMKGKLYNQERATDAARRLHEGVADLTPSHETPSSDVETPLKRRSSERIKKENEIKTQFGEVNKLASDGGVQKKTKKRATRGKKSWKAAIDDIAEESSIEYETDDSIIHQPLRHVNTSICRNVKVGASVACNKVRPFRCV